MATGDLLTERIRLVRLAHEPNTWIERIKRRYCSLWLQMRLPSVRFAMGVGISLFLISLVHGFLGRGMSTGSSNDSLVSLFSTLWQVQAGIAGAALPFLLLIIEFSKDEAYASARSSEVLIRRTGIFPVTSIALAGTLKTGVDTLWYATPGVFYVDLGMFIVMVVGTLYAYARAMQLMSSRTRMRAEAEVLLQERVAASVDSSIDTRIGNNILFKEVERLPLEYKFFKPKRKEAASYVTLSVRTEGRLEDIDLRKLERFLDGLPRRPGLEAVEVEAQPALVESEISREARRPKNVYLLKRFRERIRPDDKAVVLLEKAAFSQLAPAELEEEIQDIFLVLPIDDIDDGSEEIRQELVVLRNSLIDAVRDGRADSVVEGLRTYTELAQVFLGRLRPFNQPYTRKRVREESTWFGEGWPEIDWIQKDFQEILDEAFRHERISVLRHLLFFPISLAGIGLREGDYYLFHHFTTWLPGYSYDLSRKLHDEDLRQFVVDRCWRHLKEFSDLYVGHYLEQAVTDVRIRAIEEISEGVILTFNNLLRSTFDHRDILSFKLLLRGLRGCFEHLELRLQDMGNLRGQLEQPDLSAEDRERLKEEVRLQEIAVSIPKTIDKRRQQLLFGLEAWALRRYRLGRLKDEEFNQWHGAFGGMGSAVHLFSVLTACVQHETEDFFRWDWWVLEEHEGTGAVHIDFDSSLMQLYCLRALEELKSVPAEERARRKLPVSRETRYIFERLRETVQAMQADEGVWRPVLGDEGLAAIPALLALVDEAVTRGRQEEIDQLIAAPLDQHRINAFKEEFRVSWEEHATLRNIIKECGNYRFGGAAPTGLGFYGVNQLEPKDIFAQGEFISMHGVGENFGRSLAEQENAVVIRESVKVLRKENQSRVKPSKVIPAIDAALDLLRQRQLMPSIIILNAWLARRTIENAPGFEPVAKGIRRGQEIGSYKGCPAYAIHSRMRDMVLTMDLKAVGAWKQYVPRQEMPGEEFLAEVFTFCLQPVSDAFASELTAQKEDFKRDPETNTVLNNGEAVRRLRQRVHLRILQQFEFSVENPDAGIKIILSRDW